jgi:beta-galactosidase
MYFQWRASKAGAEKFHSGMLPHAGTATRTWREVAGVGAELARLDEVVGTRTSPEVALLFDWESWWALELPSKPSHDLQLLDQAAHWYVPFWQRNVAVDFAHPEGDLSRYRLVVAPNLYLVTDAAAENLERFVAGGGTLALAFFSGIVDERDHIRLGGYPAPFRKLLGLVVPEFWPHAEGETHEVTLDGERYSCELWSDWIELEGQKPVMAHELTHALADQNYDLQKMHEDAKGDDDRDLADALANYVRDCGHEAVATISAGGIFHPAGEVA